MINDLPISPNKKFKYSITFESWDDYSLEIGETDERGYIVEDETDTIGDILYGAGTTYGIYMPFAFGRWESTYPDEDADYFEKGIRKFYFLQITNEDGTQISDEESDFITFLLTDGRYELDKFRDYAVGGIVLGSIALGIGALITYFYFKDKKPSANKVEESSLNSRAKSVTHNINGVDKKFPIKDAWRKEHKIENKSENFEVPQGDREPLTYADGGGISSYYDDVEFGTGGVAKTKEIITKKIGLSEENADFLISKSEKYAIWLADAIIKAQLNIVKEITKEQAVKFLNNDTNILKGLSQRITGILDWLKSPNLPQQNLRELTFSEAERKSKIWHDELSVSGGDIDFTEPKENIVLKAYPKNEFGKTYYWVLLPSNTCRLESSRMGHCGQSGQSDNLISLRSDYVNSKGENINDSHITIGYGEGLFYQAKGKQNKKPLEKYFPYLFDLIKSLVKGEIKYSKQGMKFDKNNKLTKEEKVLEFNGFGSEYGAEEDYGFEDMTNEELRELYDLKPNVFNDTESILAIYDAGIITDEEIQKEYDVNSPNSIFSSFGNQIKLYDRGIILNKPSTIFEVQKDCKDVKDLLMEDNDFRDDIIENVLCGDTYELLDGFSYYYDNPSDLVDNLNKENTEEVINEIVRLTDLDKSVVTENGIEYYLQGEDEEFDADTFDNIIRALANAQNIADNNDYSTYLYDNLKSSLEELGTVHSLNDEGVKMTIDLSNLMSDEDILRGMDEYEFIDVSDMFFELIARNEWDLPNYNIDSRYSPYGSSEDFNANFEIDNYSKGGSLRPKNISINKKTKIKNMKPNQKKYADGGDLGVSKEDYFIVVKNWVYFTFNYPMGFVKDVFNSEHLQGKFSSAYERYGSMGVLPIFWANLDGNNRRILSLWVKNNYFNEIEYKTKLQSISDDDYVAIINHWNMFCLNFPYRFVSQVFLGNTSHYEQKWSRANERGDSAGAVNVFFTELDGGNQRLLTDFASDIEKFADGGKTGEKSNKNIRKKRVKSPQPKMVRQYFEDEAYDYAEGGRITNREGIIEAFLTTNRQVTVGNLATYFNKYDNQMLLRNYGTLIATRKGNDVDITNVKYSQTTSRITNEVNSMANQKGMNVRYVNEFAKGGLTEHGLKEGDKIIFDHLTDENIDIIDKDGNKHIVDLDKGERFADGGAVDLDYSDILNVLKTKIDDSIDEMPMDYENAYNFKGEEVEHESRDGFIPYTDGGYEAVWFEYLSGMWGAGKTLPTKPLNDEMNRQIDYNLDSAKDSFVDKYPEIVEELGLENIDYNSLYDAGYGEEAEMLSNDEMEMMGEDTIMMQVSAFYYSPENSRAVDGKHTIRLFGDVNLESPYHRAGNLDDSYEFEFTFDSIDELETEMAIGIAKILSWFNGDMYNESTAEMKVRRMAEGGESDDDDDDDEYAGGGEAGELKNVSGNAFYITDTSVENADKNFDSLSDTFFSSKDDFENNLDAIKEFSFNVNVKHQYNIIPAIYEQMAEEGVGNDEGNIQILGFEVDRYPKNDFESELPYDIEDDDDEDDNDEYAEGGKAGDEKPYQVYNYDTQNVEGYFDNEIEAEEFAIQFKNATVYDIREYAKGGKAGEKSTKNTGTKKRPKTRQPKMVRQYFEDSPYSYAKGGGVNSNYGKYGDDNSNLVNFDIDNLDDFETTQYQNFSKSMSKAESLQVLINSIEGDYSQLSEKLSEIAEEQMPMEHYAEGGEIYSHSEEDGATFVVTQYDNSNVATYKFDSLREAENQYDRLIDYVKEDISNDEETSTKVIALEGYIEGHGMGWETIRAFDVDEYLESFEEDDDEYAGGGSLDISNREKVDMYSYLDEVDWSYESFMERYNKDMSEAEDIIESWAKSRGFDKKYAKGGKAGEKSTKNTGTKKRPKTRQPKMVRQYFEDSPYSYAEGGEINLDYAKKEWDSYTKDAKKNDLIEAGYSKTVAEDLSSEAWESLEKQVQNDFKNNLISSELESMKYMMESLYTYDGFERGGYGFDRYLSKYIKILGEKLFNKTYNEYKKELEEGYYVDKNVHTDSEGLTYNSLKKKFAKGGEASKGLTKDEILSKYKGKYIDLLVGEDGKHIVKGVSDTPKSRYLLAEEWYEDLYAEGGEIQDWMEEALVSLIEQTGNEGLDITMVSNNGNEFFAGNDMEEYRVFKSEDDAELTAEDEVREDMEDMPENFNQDFIINYIDGGDFFEDSLNEMNRSYAEAIASESDSKYANRLIAEMVDNGLLDEDDALSDNADELAEEHIEDLVNLLTEEQMNQGNKGFDYFVDNFGQEETMKMVIKNNLIDIYKASKDAVQTDGIAHFLSRYDGETLYLSDGYVAYRNN